jgi:plastocyanin
VNRRILVILVTTVLALLAACGEDSKVGSDKLKNFESQSGDGALGATTTTAAPETTTTAAAAAPTTTAKPAPTTTAKPAPTTTAAPTPTTTQVSIVVKIQGDGQGNAFEPSNVRVYANSTIRFENVDSAAHQVRGRNGEFQSPSIAPGSSYDFKVTIAPGNYEYTDTARPYAVGYLEVLPR